jgi:CheY-like chemotaxis protein
MRDARDFFHVLLVEDDMGDAGLVKIALRRSQKRVELHHVKDGQDAMAFLRGIHQGGSQPCIPDLILLDLNLPGRSGHEILQDLKADQHLQIIPVVVLSTSDADRDIRRAYAMGANSFVTKPMDMDDFTRSIHSIVSYWFETCTLSMVLA